MEKIPNNIEYLYAFYKLSSDELSPYYNLHDSYTHLIKAIVLFNRSEDKALTKLHKNGFDTALFNNNVYTLTLSIYQQTE